MTDNKPHSDVETLESAQRRVSALTEELEDARQERDKQIKLLNDFGVTKYRLAQIVGISQQAIAKIIRKGEA